MRPRASHPPGKYGADFVGTLSTPVTSWHHDAMTSSVDPRDRSVRFSLRLTPEEYALAEKVQNLRGGHKVISLNTVIAEMITGAGARPTTGPATIHPTPKTVQAAQWAAAALNVAPDVALEQLALRGLPHTPGKACGKNPDGTDLPMPPAAIKAPSRRPAAPGTGWAPGAIGFANPVPSGLPPVKPVPNQIPMGDDE